VSNEHLPWTAAKSGRSTWNSKRNRKIKAERDRKYRVNVIKANILKEDMVREQVPKKIGHLLWAYWDFDWMPFHIELLELMFQGGNKIVVNWPTDHAKSMMATFFFPLLSLMHNPDESHIICGANFQDSKRRLQAIQRELEHPTHPELLEHFPWLERPKSRVSTSWSRTELTVAGRSANKPNPSVYAAATGSSDIRGRRGKLIMDDIEGKEHRESVQARRQLYDFVKFEAIRCYEDRNESERPLLIALGTPFDVDSIYFRLRDEDWTYIRKPVYLRPRSPANIDLKPRNHVLLWPAKLEKVENFFQSMNKEQFAIAFMLDPTAGNPTRLSLEQIRKLTLEANAPEGATRTLVSIDPASGVNQDYAGIAVVRVAWPRDQSLPKVELLEAYRFQQGLIEQVHFAADLAHKYECDVIYEINGQQGGNYADTFAHQRPEVRLLRFFTGVEKNTDQEMGLTVVRTLVKSGYLKVPATEVNSDGVRAFMQEIRDLGMRNADDHISCAVWFVVRWLYDQIRYTTELRPAVGSRVPTWRGNAGGPLSWRTWRTG
jgi:hypothetical protein